MHVERPRRDRDALFQRFHRFIGSAMLAERCGEKSVRVRIIGI
jgi:hypothetical protein